MKIQLGLEIVRSAVSVSSAKRWGCVAAGTYVGAYTLYIHTQYYSQVGTITLNFIPLE